MINDTVLLKHHIIDVIGIATPGIIKDNQHLRSSIDGSDQDIKNEFEKKYNRKMSKEEIEMIRLAYFMGKTKQFIIKDE